MPIRSVNDAAEILCMKNGTVQEGLLRVLKAFAAQWGLFGVQYLVNHFKYGTQDFEQLCVDGENNPVKMMQSFIQKLSPSAQAIMQIRSLEFMRTLTSAKGATRQDYLYHQAARVIQASMPNRVDVSYGGSKYYNLPVTQEALDMDPEKSTVLFQTYSGIWVMLWFFKEDVV